MKMRVAILTSSRADYGIYLPLLKAMKKDKEFCIKIIAFGTHLSRFHGYTINQIERDGFEVSEKLETLILGDTEEAISNAIGNTIIKFSSLWKRIGKEVDLVFALGDRYEMFAAVSASVPFNIRIAHIHGGETTLGAIDNIFRHAITLMSSIHFVSTSEYAAKVKQLIGDPKEVHLVGALSLDNLSEQKLLSLDEFKFKFNIDLSIPTILITFHPETVSSERNAKYSEILTEIFDGLSRKYQLVITMPNADTSGSLIREKFIELSDQNSNIISVENFGPVGYFSCMNYCSFLIGNSSSGIIEAASFRKYVINVGDRQKGRSSGINVFHAPIKKQEILDVISKVEFLGNNYLGENIYKVRNSAALIIDLLKKNETLY